MRRALTLLVALGVPALGLLVLKTPWHAFLGPKLSGLSPGPQELAGHLLYGLPAAVLSALALWALRLGPFSFRLTGTALRAGVLVGVASLLVSAPLLTGVTLTPHLTVWGAAGNLVSNFYEELSLRALVVLGALRCWNRPAAAVLLAGLVFALARVEGTRPQQLNLFLLGCLYAAAFLRGRNLAVPWLAHTLTDLILDAL